LRLLGLLLTLEVRPLEQELEPEQDDDRDRNGDEKVALLLFHVAG
jgi:hypothetical protein